jgi:molecular chaperone HtpG
VEVQTAEGDVWEEAASTEDTTAFTDDKGFSYTTLNEYLERNKERHENRVFYCNDPVAQATYVNLHKSQGLEVLYLDSFIDTHFISFLEREYSDVRFSRVDAEIDDTLIDKDQADEIVDPSTNKTRGDQIKELFEQSLNRPKLNIKTQALKTEDGTNAPPAMVLLPEAMRRLRDMTALYNQEMAEFPEEHILMVNTSHPLIQNLLKISQGSIITGSGDSPANEMATMICQHVYDLALMAQKGFDANGMESFVERSNQVLTTLTEKSI